MLYNIIVATNYGIRPPTGKRYLKTLRIQYKYVKKQ